MTDILRTAAEVRARTESLRRQGKRLSLVPTMGFLHEGHLSLMREGLKRAEVCAASIFVNPSQFGPNEDLSRYPRDEAGDLEKCRSAGVAFIYAPAPAEVYPPGYQTWVDVAELQLGLCGGTRPGHFRGVATVVTKLLSLFRPDVALFGEKDFQQLQVIRRLNRDLDLGAEIVGMPILREADGLAMSSRNAYLAPEERRQALALSRALNRAAELRRTGERQVEALVAAARAELAGAQIREDYVAVVDAESLQPLTSVDRPARMLLAGFVGRTRLIDNAAV